MKQYFPFWGRSALQRAEVMAGKGSIGPTLEILRTLSLDAFGKLMFSLPDPRYPNLNRMLPAMASEEVQRNWTGNSGPALLRQTVDFAADMAEQYEELAKRSLKGGRILDYGCGYGRIVRLMYYFSDPERIFAVDPWDESIRLCRESRILGQLAVSEYLPESLPISERQFDLIYCFSVFTHLSQRATACALKTLRNHIRSDGILVMTIRPEGYWAAAGATANGRSVEDVVSEHRRCGFAFVPHLRAAVDGDVTYGDTSMTAEWLEKEFPSWQVAAEHRHRQDPFQMVLYLRPV